MERPYYFDPALGTQAVGQKNIKGHWYYFDAKKGMATGLTYLPDQKKVVYYNNQGQMQYGQQDLNGTTYYFDLVTGEQLKDNVAYNRKTGQINYYGKDGKQAQGTINLAGKTYNFTKGYLQVNGKSLVTVKGQTYLLNGNRVATGQQYFNNHWYYFNPTSGKMATGLTYLSDQKKTVYYNGAGQMQYGQQNISGHWYLFDGVTGAMKTGLQWIGSQNKTVYYADNGQMQYGQKNLAGHWYYFNPGTGAMATGITYLPDQHKTVYYAANGQMQYGQQQINGAWYYFEEGSGAMIRGLKAIPSQGKIVYYGNDGKMKYGTFREGWITYYADNVSGAIHGVYNDAQVIAQRPELPTGCEITAVAMMLRYAGLNVSKTQLADEMPRSNNGDYGFVGNPYSVTGWWVFPGGVAPVINRHMGHSQIMTGTSMNAIQDKLLHGHLVVVWMGYMNGFSTHAVTLTGYNNGTIYYNNPWTARKESMSVSDFYWHWNRDAQRAISY